MFFVRSRQACCVSFLATYREAMRAEFPEFFPLSEADFKDLWARGLVVVDTNILLRLYRYSDTTVDELLGVLASFADRLWIPHQVAWEYNRRRLTKIKEAERSYRELLSDFQKAAESGRAKLQATKEFGIHPKVDLADKITALIAEIEAQTTAISSQYDASPTGSHYATLHDRVAALYHGRIGSGPAEAELAELCQEGLKRFEAGRPPGFKDVEEKRKRGATDREVFGDFLIWNEILLFAENRKLPVIFVTEDAKDDWWLREDGKTIGPLPELRREFIGKVGQQVHFYRVQTFLEQAKERISASVSAKSVEDVTKNTPLVPEWIDEDTDWNPWHRNALAHTDRIQRRRKHSESTLTTRNISEMRYPEHIESDVAQAEINLLEARLELDQLSSFYRRALERPQDGPDSHASVRALRQRLSEAAELVSLRERDFQMARVRASGWHGFSETPPDDSVGE